MICLWPSSCSTMLRGKNLRRLLAVAITPSAASGANRVSSASSIFSAGTTKTFSSMFRIFSHGRKTGLNRPVATLQKHGGTFLPFSFLRQNQKGVFCRSKTDGHFEVEYLSPPERASLCFDTHFSR